MSDPVELQRQYYEATAGAYDEAHAEPEHVVAMHLLAAYIELTGIRSVLDVGAGTGRAMRFLKGRFPHLEVKGVEPVEALRRRGHAKGIPEQDLLAGDGASLPFADRSFDLVCEFAVLHHVVDPRKVIAEMNRVASRMVAVSDCNFMGQGPFWLRLVKTGLWVSALWPLANWVKTRGKGYTYSDSDGIAYSYSVYQNLRQFRLAWKDVEVFATCSDGGTLSGPILSAGHVLLLARQRRH